MRNDAVRLKSILPVMAGFFVMGLMDIVGVVIKYASTDFGISGSVANLVSVACFCCFLIIPVPMFLLMGRIGKRRAVSLSILASSIGLVIPAISYSFVSVVVAFGFIGLGNASLVVTLNPLVADTVRRERLAAAYTAAQCVKSASTLLAPLLAAAFAGSVLGWRAILPVYALVSMTGAVWLMLSKDTVEPEVRKEIGFKSGLRSVYGILADHKVRRLFIGALLLIGIDTGFMILLPGLFQNRFGLVDSEATMYNSLYYFSRLISSFIAGFLLLKISSRRYFIFCVILESVCFIGLAFSGNYALSTSLVALAGFATSNLYPILLATAIRINDSIPADSVTSLFACGLAGGAIIPPLLGLCGSPYVSLAILSVVAVLLLVIFVSVRK